MFHHTILWLLCSTRWFPESYSRRRTSDGQRPTVTRTTLRIGSFWFIILRRAVLRRFLGGLSHKLTDTVYKSGLGGMPHRGPVDHPVGWCKIARTEIFELFAPALFRQWAFSNHFR